MAAQNYARLCYRFAAYQVTPDSREIRKNGTRIKLHEQPFEVLLALLERPGELVKREELRNRLWPGDTFVDFDKGLNTAVNKVRQALSDSAADPRYIETVPRHGYRFLANVERMDSSAAGSGIDNKTPESTIPPAVAEGRSRTTNIAARAGIAGSPALLLLVLWIAYHRWFTTPDPELLHLTPLTSYPGIERSPSFSPDGSQVAFERRQPGASQSDICVLAVGSAESVDVAATPANEFSPAWSPNGSVIAYLRSSSETHMDLMLVPPTGGEPQRLTSITYPHTADLLDRSDLLAWSPDGNYVIFSDAGAGEYAALWRINARSSRRTQMTFPAPREWHSLPRISADGRWLAFRQDNGQRASQVLAVGLDGNGLPAGRQLLVINGPSVGPLGWVGNQLLVLPQTPDFTLDRWSPSGNLQVMRVASAGGPGTRLGSGVLARDGRRLALSLDTIDGHVWQMDLRPDGTGLNARPFIVSTHLDGGGDYARDGKHIVFVSTRTGDFEAWIAATDGSHLRQVTHTGGVLATRFSPDGVHILFNRSENKSYHLFVADVETGSTRRITPDHPWSDVNGHWSSDGAWIYFDSDRTGRQEVWKIATAGGEPTQITRNGGVNPFESPDGKYLYYGRDESGVGYVWRMPLVGGTEERLFPALVNNSASLAMGSRRMYFVRGPNTYGFGEAIYSYDLASGHICKVAEVGASVFYMSPSPDESQLLFGRGSTAGADLMLVEGLHK